jgi:hypothetical protein
MLGTEVDTGTTSEGLRWRLRAWHGGHEHLTTVIEFTRGDEFVASESFSGWPAHEDRPISSWISAAEGCPSFLVLRARPAVTSVHVTLADGSSRHGRLSEPIQPFAVRFGAIELPRGAAVVRLSAETGAGPLRPGT